MKSNFKSLIFAGIYMRKAHESLGAELTRDTCCLKCLRLMSEFVNSKVDLKNFRKSQDIRTFADSFYLLYKKKIPPYVSPSGKVHFFELDD